jgi:RNA polymerase sigma factor (sigma-70 family)
MTRKKAGEPDKPRKERIVRSDAADAAPQAPLASLKDIGTAVWKYAFRRTGDRDVADDAQQAVAFKVHVTRQTSPTYAGAVAKIGAFANRTSANELNMLLRRQRTHDDAAQSVAEQQQIYLTWRDDPEQQFNRNEFWAFVDLALASLEEEDRIVWTMARRRGKSSAEIAEARGTTTGAIDTRLSRAGDKMKAYFVQHGINHSWEILS